jgi:hypothetical protein
MKIYFFYLNFIYWSWYIDRAKVAFSLIFWFEVSSSQIHYPPRLSLFLLYEVLVNRDYSCSIHILFHMLQPSARALWHSTPLPFLEICYFPPSSNNINKSNRLFSITLIMFRWTLKNSLIFMWPIFSFLDFFAALRSI